MGLIYIAKSKTSGKSYVGQTRKTLALRLRTHVSTDKKRGMIFPYALRKYGRKDFEFVTIDCVPDELLDEWERYFIRELNTIAPNGYNLTEGGEGGRHTKETIERIAKKNRGRKHTDKEKARIRELWAMPNSPYHGIPQTEEAKAKIREKRKLQIITKGGRAKGFHHSEETRKRISESHKGMKYPPEWCERQSKIRKKMVISKETRAKMAASMKGHPNWYFGKKGKPNG